MRNRLLPRTEWFRFFEEFSRRYEGWLVTVRVLHPSFGSQVEARDLPLEGIVSPADASGPISIHLGGSTKCNVEHEIPSPRQVWVEISEKGAEEALGVVSEDGTKTTVEFRVAALPETVDDILRP
ncbi:MAG: DUF5335 family protein [Thermoanaerobaculia bacterium]